MRRVANELGTRDHRHSMVASSHRAALEARLLKVVTKALARIQRQQGMLMQVVGPFNTAMAGLQYKCLACDRPTPPTNVDGFSASVGPMAGTMRGSSSASAVDARYKAHTRATMRTQGAGFRVPERPRTANTLPSRLSAGTL